MIENRISNKSKRNLERNINSTVFIEPERKGNRRVMLENRKTKKLRARNP
jgi:hypothetical protein